jgi:hypothetical protein
MPFSLQKLANATRASLLGTVFWFSHRLIVAKDTFTALANSSWLKPAVFRAFLTIAEKSSLFMPLLYQMLYTLFRGLGRCELATFFVLLHLLHKNNASTASKTGRPHHN